MLINVSMQLDDRAVDAVKTKFFKNYKNWCKFLGRKHSLRYQATFYFHKWLEWDTFWMMFILLIKIHSFNLCEGFLKVLKIYNNRRYCIWVFKSVLADMISQTQEFINIYLLFILSWLMNSMVSWLEMSASLLEKISSLLTVEMMRPFCWKGKCLNDRFMTS